MRTPLRAALLGIAVTLAGYALFAGWLGLHADGYLDARDRATARTTGVVVEDGIGDDLDIRVRWTDGTGRTHVQRFGVYDTDRYAEGKDFRVAYDPTAGDPRGFPADPDETAEEDDLIVPVFLGAAVALPLTLVWLWRGLRFRLAARRPGRPMTARVRTGTRRAAWRASRATWLELTGPEGRTHWQRVMWHPALHEAPAELPVTVHGTGRRTVTALPDGTRLVSLGRPRDHPPAGAVLDDDVLRTDLRDAFVLPPGTTAAPPWREAAASTGLGTLLGLTLGLVMTGPTLTGTLAFVLSCATLTTSVWLLSAPQP
ncbi:hypothetical protein [Streptomyces griseoruber]|uniref:DUF3592 domain-containing protein n=1 Tax=Streptomyces griseoruber TaxID=1943 RepID=A0A117RDA9_9ACTN|nr:hypothetical protein [Streptomyces griseoruber]KUN84480.1 hypothetical protein AQJ64_15190 [Streptomyces griseoruber]